MFTGREWAAGYGFYEFRARAYNPALGRFMSEDPVGFAAGDTNQYRYCGGDPVNWVDPSGLFREFEIPFQPLDGQTGDSPSIDTFDAETDPGGYAAGSTATSAGSQSGSSTGSSGSSRVVAPEATPPEAEDLAPAAAGGQAAAAASTEELCHSAAAVAAATVTAAEAALG